jgi:hypothetical protein
MQTVAASVRLLFFSGELCWTFFALTKTRYLPAAWKLAHCRRAQGGQTANRNN